MIRARMRSGASWNDVCILNLSVRGLGIQTAQPPSSGAYVEICRGTCVIVARVVWSRGHRAGLRSQDAIFIQSIVNETLAPSQRMPVTSARPVDRRRAPRTALQRQDDSRLAGRAMEFACFALVAGVVAMAAFGTVEQALAQPLSKVSATLGDS